MRKSGIDKMALLVVLGAAALVVAAAAGTAPAYSDDTGNDPVAAHQPTPVEPLLGLEAEPGSTSAPAPIDAPTIADAAAEGDGYEWSGSRPADDRYLWSHRPN